jgi:ubiquinone/menaquinone biosynthesis C-methylase UbiE
MNFDYDRVAPDYDTHRRGGGPYFPLLLEIARSAAARRVIELGAGTGNNSAAVLEAFPCSLIALDASTGMLRQLQAKRTKAKPLRGEATALPFRDGCADFVFATYLLHHVSRLGDLMRECFRVLRTGPAAFVTVSHEYIRAHPMNAYFPSFARVDCARFQPVSEVCDAMCSAGFARVMARDVFSPPRPMDADYVERVASKFISTYALIPSPEFEAGLARLRADVERAGQAPPIVRGATVVWGWKECA